MTAQGQPVNLQHIANDSYRLTFPPSVNVCMQIEVLIGEKQRQVVKPDIPKPVENLPVPAQSAMPEPVDSIGWFNPLALLANKSKALFSAPSNKNEIVKAEGLAFDQIDNKHVLAFDQTNCWNRGLGMIVKAANLEYQIGKPLHVFFHRITGQGNGAIVAAACAYGIPLNTLVDWWRTDWRKAHTPNLWDTAKRQAVKFVRPHTHGYDAKKAKKSLNRLFRRSDPVLTLDKAKTELQINAILGDLLIVSYRSWEKTHARLTVADAVIDSAITRFDYNEKNTVRGKPPFLGEIEKNDSLGLLLNDNGSTKITSIGAPVRLDPGNSKSLSKSDQAGMKVINRDKSHFVHLFRVDQLVKKLEHVRYLRLECSSIDDVVLNSTTERAMQSGQQSGEGFIELPSWYR